MKKDKNKIGQLKGRVVRREDKIIITKILSDRPKEPELLIEYLHLIQDRYNCLPAGLLVALADFMGLSLAAVYEVASFYHHFDIVEEEAHINSLTIRVCNGIACEILGSKKLYDNLREGAEDNYNLVYAPCVGACDRAPVSVVGKSQVFYGDIARIKKLRDNPDKVVSLPPYQDLNSYSSQKGYIIFNQLRDQKISKLDVTEILKVSDLRGMGGAGFPVFKKWEFMRNQSKPRVLVVNADEGEPGTFKDRYCLENYPHIVLEGSLISAWVNEVDEIYIYLRDEYPQVRQILENEIKEIESAGLFARGHIKLRRGAGAYICGEETALLESIEGKRGLPRNRPPYPAENGLFGMPTLVHNVETLYWITKILLNGADWYKQNGSPRIYSVSGRVASPGVVIAPSGVSARELIYDYCGGMSEGEEFKAYLPGGASGGILPSHMSDIPLEFGSLEEYGCFVGSGGIVVFSDQDNIIQIVLNLLRFFAEESCGQCTPCRLGCDKLINLTQQETRDEVLIEEIISVMRDASICGLGQAAPNPLSTVLRYMKSDLI